MPDPVHADVVRVPVPAVVVVDGQHVGALLREDLCQAGGSLLLVGGAERHGVVVRGRARHARVAVAEELDPVGSEYLGCAKRLFGPPGSEVLSWCQEALGDLAHLATGRHHEDNSVALGRRSCGHPAGGDALVVWMGVERHEGASHRRIFSEAGVVAQVAAARPPRPTLSSGS